MTKILPLFPQESMTEPCRIAINLSPQFLPKPLLWMNLLRQKVSFLIKLFLKKPSERRRRILKECYAILYECTALTS